MHGIYKVHKLFRLTVGIVKSKEIKNMIKMLGNMLHNRHKFNCIKAVVRNISQDILRDLFYCSLMFMSFGKRIKRKLTNRKSSLVLVEFLSCGDPLFISPFKRSKLIYNGNNAVFSF